MANHKTRAKSFYDFFNKVFNDFYRKQEQSGSRYQPRYIEKEFIPLEVFEDPEITNSIIEFAKKKNVKTD